MATKVTTVCVCVCFLCINQSKLHKPGDLQSQRMMLDSKLYLSVIKQHRTASTECTDMKTEA